MFCIKMAGLTIQVCNQYQYVRHLCKDDVVPDTDGFDLSVTVEDQEIKKEIEESDFPVSEGYAEGICVYRKICQQLPLLFGAFLMHCAVIEYEGNGYAFAAASGTGKSTHISLWQKKFGESVRIINGDKPIMRFVDDLLYAYGTPWCGKEGYNVNTAVPLKALCFLERSSENRISKITPKEAVMRVFHQVLTPSDVESLDAFLPLLDRMLRQIPCYVLGCNISEEAAEVSYRGMRGNNLNEKEESI